MNCKECEEQARLLGMGAERELKLMAENAALREELRNVGAMIPCSSGGTFVNDPPDAIVDALARYMNEVRHENESLRKQIEVAREALVLAIKGFYGGFDIAHTNRINAALAAIGDAQPCDMGQMCLNCQPRGANGECPDAKPASGEVKP